MFLEPGLYAFHLDRVLRYFAKEQLHITIYDDLKQDPETFLTSTFSFIGADPGFRPECLHTDINPEAPEANPDEMSEDLREHIRAFYREDIARLETMLERDLSAWK